MSSADKIDWSLPITARGERRPLEDWAQLLGLTPGSLKNRIRKLGVEQALDTRRMTAAESGRLGGHTWRRRFTSPALRAR